MDRTDIPSGKTASADADRTPDLKNPLAPATLEVQLAARFAPFLKMNPLSRLEAE